MDGSSEALVAAGYDAVYEAVPRAPTLWQIWLDHAVGREFPSEFSHITFATLSDLHRLTEALQLGDDRTLVDLACGMGGPSLWMASQLPIRLTLPVPVRDSYSSGPTCTPVTLPVVHHTHKRVESDVHTRVMLLTVSRTN